MSALVFQHINQIDLEKLVMSSLQQANLLTYQGETCQNEHYGLKWHNLIEDENLQFQIHEQKPLEQSKDKYSWKWYKNLVIPAIQISLSGQNRQTSEDAMQTVSLSGFNAELSCIKIRNLSEISGEAVLKGQTSVKINEIGKTKFQGIKFYETTFNSKCSYFRLVVTIYQKCANDVRIIQISTSPHISVDARKKSWINRQNISYIFDPFLPDFLDKYNENNAEIKEKESLKLNFNFSKDLINLMNYLKNPYIRHKTVHPLFLLINFPNAVIFYYNHEIMEDLNKIPIKNIPTIIQNEINKNQNVSSPLDSFRKKSFVLALNITENQSISFQTITEKINSYLKRLNNGCFLFTKHIPKCLPKSFIAFQYQAQQLKESYKKNYQQLQKIKFQNNFLDYQQLLEQFKNDEEKKLNTSKCELDQNNNITNKGSDYEYEDEEMVEEGSDNDEFMANCKQKGKQKKQSQKKSNKRQGYYHTELVLNQFSEQVRKGLKKIKVEKYQSQSLLSIMDSQKSIKKTRKTSKNFYLQDSQNDKNTLTASTELILY